ncbi:MAG TPA: hypothetical protein VH370_26650 [Humisphaera sp.]|nr:hypothetical protein [Humisphaera sp.]
MARLTVHGKRKWGSRQEFVDADIQCTDEQVEKLRELLNRWVSDARKQEAIAAMKGAGAL